MRQCFSLGRGPLLKFRAPFHRNRTLSASWEEAFFQTFSEAEPNNFLHGAGSCQEVVCSLNNDGFLLTRYSLMRTAMHAGALTRQHRMHPVRSCLIYCASIPAGG